MSLLRINPLEYIRMKCWYLDYNFLVRSFYQSINLLLVLYTMKMKQV